MNNIETMRTGKTGVAFGLIRSRDGGRDVQLINLSHTESDEVPFPYLIGNVGSNDQFNTIIGHGIGYNEWAFFDYCMGNEVELYYTSEPRALENNLPIEETKHVVLYVEDEHVDDDANIFVRKVAPDTIEFAVGYSDEFQSTAIDASRIYRMALPR